MQRRMACLFFIVIFLVEAFAGAAGIRCEDVSTPQPATVYEFLQSFDQENNHFLFQGKEIEDHIASASWLRRRKIHKLLVDTKLKNLSSQQDVETYAIKLGQALFGRSDSLDSWIFLEDDQRLENMAVLSIKEQILRDGILKIWAKTNRPETISLLKRILQSFRHFNNSTTGQVLSFPWRLPEAKRFPFVPIETPRLPDDFIVAVMADGFPAHAEEARVLLRATSHLDAYNTFRRIYAATFFGAMAIFNITSAYAQLEIHMDEEIRTSIASVEKSTDHMTTQVDDIKKQIFNEAYQKSINQFVAIYGEPPTPAEDAKIRAKIAMGLFGSAAGTYLGETAKGS